MSKGYKRDKPVYLLRFEDEQFDGLEVMARSLPLGEFLELQKTQATAATDPEAAEKIVKTLAGVLSSWNLEDDDDTPVPCNFDGLKEQDFPFVLAILEAWMTAVAGVPNHSKPALNDGGTSLELSIPMEQL